MARIRTIKPDFWTDERLTECSLSARLMFIGMWNFADDSGNMGRSAKKLKMQIFPGDNIDCEPLIAELLTHGVLTEYSVNGEKYLQIKNFLKHQVINRPTASSIPPPQITDDSHTTHGGLTEDSKREGKGREGSNTEPTVLVASKKLATAKAPPLPPCPVDQVIEVYHELLPELPRVRLMDDKRKRCITRTWRWVLTSKKSDGSPRACTSDEALGWMRNFFERARDNDFLMGRGQRGAGHENWRCDLDFLLTDKGMKHVIEKTGAAA